MDRETLRKKLKEKIQGKKILRSSNNHKESLLDNELEKSGIDVAKFKEQMKSMNPNLLKEQLKKLNISI
jgi:hypothetical protein